MIPRHPETRRLLAWLLPVLGLAAVLRLVGIGYGLPHPLVAGEDALVGAALRMAETGELVPSLGDEVARMLQVPPLLAWLYLLVALPVVAVAWLADGLPGGPGLAWAALDNMGAVLVAARLTGVAMSVATVALAALVARRLFGTRIAGIAAGLLLATSWLASAVGHTAQVWSATAFFVWLAVWLALRYASRPGPRRAAAVGAAAALGFGASGLGAAGLLAGLLALVPGGPRRSRGRDLAWMVGPFALGVLLFAAAHWQAAAGLFSRGPGDAAATAALGQRVLWWADPVLLAGGAAGLVLIALSGRLRLAAALAGGAAAWTALVTLAGPAEDRAVLPLLPLLALSAGGGAAVLARHLPWRLVLPAGALGGLLLLYPLATTAWFSWLLAATDTRVAAADWLGENLPAGAAVVVDLDPVTLPASLDGLLDQELLLPGSLDARMRLALESGWPDDEAPRPRAVHVHRAPAGAVTGDAGARLFETLRETGYGTFAIAVRDGVTPTGLQRAMLQEGYRERASFLASMTRGAPSAPDLGTSVLVDGPVWRLFLLDRLGRSVVIGEVPPG